MIYYFCIIYSIILSYYDFNSLNENSISLVSIPIPNSSIYATRFYITSNPVTLVIKYNIAIEKDILLMEISDPILNARSQADSHYFNIFYFKESSYSVSSNKKGRYFEGVMALKSHYMILAISISIFKT